MRAEVGAVEERIPLRWSAICCGRRLALLNAFDERDQGCVSTWMAPSSASSVEPFLADVLVATSTHAYPVRGPRARTDRITGRGSASRWERVSLADRVFIADLVVGLADIGAASESDLRAPPARDRPKLRAEGVSSGRVRSMDGSFAR